MNQNALALLETRRRAYSKRWREEQSRRAEEQPNLGNVSTVKGRPGLDRMGDWVEQLGYSVLNTYYRLYIFETDFNKGH
jgi:hypothetical protein